MISHRHEFKRKGKRRNYCIRFGHSLRSASQLPAPAKGWNTIVHGKSVHRTLSTFSASARWENSPSLCIVRITIVIATCLCGIRYRHRESTPRRRISIIRDRDCRSRFNDETKMERSFNNGSSTNLSHELRSKRYEYFRERHVRGIVRLACESRNPDSAYHENYLPFLGKFAR